MTNCHNCGAITEGRYCAECGQEQVSGRFELRSVVAVALSEAFSLNRGALATAYRLTVAPAKLVRDYWQRRTKPYVNPVRYFLVAVAALQLVLWQTGAAPEMVREFLAGYAAGGPALDDVLSPAAVLQSFADFFVLFFVAGVLLLALASRWGSPRNVAEELILQLYTWGHLAFLWSLIGLFVEIFGQAPQGKGWFGGGVLALTAAYYVWVDAGAHGPDTEPGVWRDGLRAIGTLAVFAVGYAFLAGTFAGAAIAILS